MMLLTLLCSILLNTTTPQETKVDTLPSKSSHIGAQVSVLPGKAISVDRYQKTWMKKHYNMAIDARLNYRSLPKDSDHFAEDYHYPTLSVGMRYHFNHGVTMHKDKADWPGIIETDFDSQMGNIVSVYGAFSRPLLRKNRWEIDYTIIAGTGYSHRKYDKQSQIYNEMIGARWLIFFGLETSLSYQFSKDFAMQAGLTFYHHSNGAINRPNKGCNVVAPQIGVSYRPYQEETTVENISRHPFKPFIYWNVSPGIGLRTLFEEWQITQYSLPQDDPDHHTDQFKTYITYSLQADMMYRYARRWASGIGIDLFYGDYYKRAQELNERYNHTEKLSPWSLGICVKHEVFYHRLSLAMSAGYYLHRKMGELARQQEKSYYERIGINYVIPGLGGIKIGAHVKAHLTKADLTELVISVPIVKDRRLLSSNW